MEESNSLQNPVQPECQKTKDWLCGNWDFKDLAASLQTNHEQSVFSGAISTLLPWPHTAPTFFFVYLSQVQKEQMILKLKDDLRKKRN